MNSFELFDRSSSMELPAVPDMTFDEQVDAGRMRVSFMVDYILDGTAEIATLKARLATMEQPSFLTKITGRAATERQIADVRMQITVIERDLIEVENFLRADRNTQREAVMIN